jgi:hypothetical protein
VPAVTRRHPHRPVRAQLTHTVPQVMDSLPLSVVVPCSRILISEYRSVFPNNDSMTRPPPSLLPGSFGTCVRLVSNGTMRRLRLPSCFSRCSVRHIAPRYLGLILRLRSLGRENRRLNAWALLTGIALAPVFVLKDTFGSPKFPANPSCICPALRLRPGLHARLVTAFRYCPRAVGRRGPRRGITFEAQSHGFCTGCLRFVPPSRTTTQNSLPVVSQTFPGGLFHAH